MLFNSYPFIFLFLPISVAVYFLLNRLRWYAAGNAWIALASLFFYGYWNIKYLPLLLGSITYNYFIGWLLAGTRQEEKSRRRKAVLITGIAGNVALLAYYKYTDFFLTVVEEATGTPTTLLHIVLPLGISFFTFTQIAYLVDAYKGKVKETNPVNYVLFVTFFPHLIAGPILHHSEMMPQFDRLRGKFWNWQNVARGCTIFCIGLFKKVVIADTLAIHANNGFDTAVNALESWVAVLSYTFQLYFDFSGYTDMAIGAALILNIRLPQNFNSPYKAVSIQDFWRRWHMTLSRFLRDYIYIPLGGNRRGELVAARNLLITFLIGGFWHGAGWTFIFWGLLHGVAQAIHRVWMKSGRKLPVFPAWLLTFLFINVTWVFFRAEDWGQAIRILEGMAFLHGSGLPQAREFLLPLLLLAAVFPIVVFARNSTEQTERMRPSFRQAAFIAALFVVSLLFLNRISEFLYFNF